MEVSNNYPLPLPQVSKCQGLSIGEETETSTFNDPRVLTRVKYKSIESKKTPFLDVECEVLQAEVKCL